MNAIIAALALTLALVLGPDGGSGGGPPDATLPAVSPVAPATGAGTDPGCDRWAAPSGRDPVRRRGRGRRPGSDRGDRARPLRTVPALARSLAAGETGCLLPGRYRHAAPAKLTRPGTRLVGVDGRVRVDGAIWLTGRARGAELRGLDLTASDSSFFIPLKIQANEAVVADNRIRGARSTTCVLVGSTRRAVGVRIERNWIRRCGRVGKLDHLIYLQQTSGAVVRGNVLASNPGGWAVHMYPDADRTRVERNLIDGNRGGVIFAGEDDRSSDGNVVRANVIAFSAPRWNVEGSWDDVLGRGNVAYSNCLYSEGPSAPSGVGPVRGFELGENLVETSSPFELHRPRRYRIETSDGCDLLVSPLPPAFPGA